MNTAKLVLIAKDKNLQIGVAAALSAAAGGAAGYVFAKKKLRTHYENIAMREIEEAKNFYGSLHKKDEDSSPEKVLAKLHGPGAAEAVQAHRVYLGQADAPVATEEELMVEVEEEVVEEAAPLTIVNNIFIEDEREFDYEKEASLRTETEPYIITEDEYLQSETGYEQSALTYYEGDGVLADDEDIPVPDSDALIGDDHLARFGHGSRSENVVFVRNDRIEMEFEVERSFGSFTEEVAGFNDDEDSIKHSAGIRKFRGHDD